MPRIERGIGPGQVGALGGSRTPNRLIRSQVLYPLSYQRRLVRVGSLGARRAERNSAPEGSARRERGQPALYAVCDQGPQPPERWYSV